MSLKRNLVVRVQVGTYLAVLVNDVETGKGNQEYVYTNFLKDPDALKLIEKIGSIVNYNHVKAVLLDCQTFESFNDGYKLRQRFYEFCKHHGIFYLYLPSNSSFESFATIFHSKVLVKEGEEIMIIFSFMPGVPDGISYVREKNHYRKIGAHHSFKRMLSPAWKREFMGNSKPNKVVVLQLFDTATAEFKQCFQEYDPIVLTVDDDCQIYHVATIAKVLYYMEEKLNPYDVISQFEAEMHVCVGFKSVIKVMAETVLPFKQSVIVEVKPTKTISLHVTVNQPQSEVIQRIKMSEFTSKKVKISLKVDINSFYDFKVEPYEEKKELLKDDTAAEPSSQKRATSSVDNLEGNFSDIKVTNKTTTEKVRIMFSKQNFSVYVFDDGKESVLPDFILHSMIKSQSLEKMLWMYTVQNQNLLFSVYLIKLCSTTNPDIMNPKWGFRILKKDETMIVVVKTSEGEGQFSIDFLLSLILKHGIKLVGNDRKIDVFEIGFIGFNPNETLKETFQKAAKHLNLKIAFC